MTPEIHKSFNQIKMYTELMAGVLSIIDVEFLEKFEDDARIWANGTMSPILAHDMSIRDLNASERNLTHAIQVSKKIRELIALLTTESPKNQKDL